MGLIKEQRGYARWLLGLHFLNCAKKTKLGKKIVCKTPECATRLSALSSLLALWPKQGVQSYNL